MPPYIFACSQQDHSLTIIDAVNPLVPALVGNVHGIGTPNWLGGAYRVKAYGNYAYVCAQIGDMSLTVVDISDLRNPVTVGHIAGAGAPNFLGTINGMFLGNGTFNGYVYIAVLGGDACFSIFDVSDPTNPTLASRTTGAGAPNYLASPRDCAVAGNYAYVVSHTSDALIVFDVSNPAAPFAVASLRGGANGLVGPAGIVLRGNYAYVASSFQNAFAIIDITNPLAPAGVGFLAGIGAPEWLQNAHDVAVWDHYAAVSARLDNRLTIIDFINPAVPVTVGTVAMSNPNGLSLSYPYAYVSVAGTDRINVVDVTNPAAPAIVGVIAGAGAPNWLNSASDAQLFDIYLPTVSTDAASAIGKEEATLNGTLDDDSGEACDCGFEWGETVAYGNTTPTQSRTIGQTFAQTITGLDRGKTYHFKAFAVNPAGTSHGSDQTFTTLAAPTVSTNPASAVGQTTATLNGTLDDDGDLACDCSFEYGETIGYGSTTSTQSKTTGETFSQEVLGLKGGTVYHFRAIATNSVDTSYGDDRTFHTEALSAEAHQALGRGYALGRAGL